jgi:hypothetical protein
MLRVYTQPRVNRGELVRQGDQIALRRGRRVIDSEQDYVSADLDYELVWRTVERRDGERLHLDNGGQVRVRPDGRCVTRERVELDPWTYVDPDARPQLVHVGADAPLR